MNSHENNISLKNLRLLIKHHFTDQPYDHPVQDRNLNVVSLELSLNDFYKSILEFKDKFSFDVIENINYKDRELPIYQVDINNHNMNRLFILSGTHGNEQAGILCISRLLSDISDNPDFYNNISMRIITPHNPVAALEFSRFNADGIDINRDFKNQRTKEVKAVINSLEEYNPKYSLSLHEGPQESGTFIYTNKLVAKQTAFDVLKYTRSKGVKLAKKNYFSRKLKYPGYFPLTGINFLVVSLWSELLNMQPFGYFCYTKGIKNFTTETSWQDKNKEARIQAQLLLIKGVVNTISKQN